MRKLTRRKVFQMIAAAFAGRRAAVALPDEIFKTMPLAKHIDALEALNDGINPDWDGKVYAAGGPEEAFLSSTSYPDPVLFVDQNSLRLVDWDSISLANGPIEVAPPPGEVVFWLNNPKFPFVQHSQDCQDAWYSRGAKCICGASKNADRAEPGRAES